MSTVQVNPNFIYELFSDIYYTKEFPVYTDLECSVTETIDCLLRAFFMRKTRRALLNSKIVILSFGDLIHMALREPLLKRGFKCEQEGKYEIGKYTLYSHTDAVHDNLGLEFKTITRKPHEVLTHHFLQANAYFHIQDLHEIHVVYIHKPSGTVTTYPIQPHTPSFDYVKTRAIRFCYSLTHNITPNPEPSWRCLFCEFTDVCPTPLKTVRGGM